MPKDESELTDIIRNRVLPMLPSKENVGGHEADQNDIELTSQHIADNGRVESKHRSHSPPVDCKFPCKRKGSPGVVENCCLQSDDSHDSGCRHSRPKVGLSTLSVQTTSPTSVHFDVDIPIERVDSHLGPAHAPLPSLRLPYFSHHKNLVMRENEQQRYLRPLLQKLIFHQRNRNVFNAPVDVEGLRLYNYNSVIKNPNDLGTVKERLLSLQYPDWGSFRRDVRLVFLNALTYNPEGHEVHKAAQTLLDFFDEEYAKVLQKHLQELQRRASHTCGDCRGLDCLVCNEKCIVLDPPVLACAGTCGAKVKRGGIYYVTASGDRLWCQRCYTGLPATLPAPDDEDAGSHCTLRKDLLKRCFTQVRHEPWVECAVCHGRAHQVCVFHSQLAVDRKKVFICGWCEEGVERPANRSLDLEEVKRKALMDGPPGVGGEIAGGVTAGVPEGKKFASALGDVARTASELPETTTSRFIETMVRAKLRELGEGDIAESVTVRVLSSMQYNHTVPPTVLDHFGKGRAEATYTYEYQSKAIYIFQRVDGVDVCFFCMYVQEYGDDAPEGNRKRGYVAYLDSVDWFRPRRLRTDVYHEALLAYVTELHLRDFRAVHLWSCPPTRGNNFIFWCHPSHQRSPGPDRLRDWYSRMGAEAERRGVVQRRGNMYDLFFAEDRAVKELPPIFDGDFWVAEVDRVSKRRGFSNSSGKPLPLDTHCQYVLLNLLNEKHAQDWFGYPVDPVALNLPTYTSVVKRPMDLGTVGERLRAGKYSTAEAFAADVLLTFDNALGFNPRGHPVHAAAVQLKAFFLRDFENMQRHVDPSEVMTLSCSPVPVSSPVPSSVDAESSSAPAPSSASTRPSALAASVAKSVEKHKSNLFVLDLQHSCGVCGAFISRHAEVRGCERQGCGRFVVCGECGKDEVRVASKHDPAHLEEFVHRSLVAPPEEVVVRYKAEDAVAEGPISYPLVDSRHMFLEWCQTHSYQFDSLRRAKFSTAMILRHMSLKDKGKSLQLACSVCLGSLAPTRWHCSSCGDLNLCGDCVVRIPPDDDHTCAFVENGGNEHLLTPFRVA